MTTDAEKAAEEWAREKYKGAKVEFHSIDSNGVIASIALPIENVHRLVRHSFLAGMEHAAPKWVSVERELPERRKLVLIYHDVWSVTCGHLSQTSPEIVWRDERGDNIETSSVLYWMPLPAVPEGHENDRSACSEIRRSAGLFLL